MNSREPRRDETNVPADRRIDDPWRAGIDSTRLAFFDVEMTGLDPASDRICEIAIVRVERGVRVDTFASLVHPDVPVRPDAFAVHGITADALTSAPSFDTIAPRIVALFRGAVPVGHGTDLDVDFLNRAFRAANVAAPDLSRRLDTLVLARRALPSASHSLDALAARLGLDQRPRHRALDDAETVRVLFARLVREFGATTAEDLSQVRVGQRDTVIVRDAIARALEHFASSHAPCCITIRTRGRPARSVPARVEDWSSPHARITDVSGAHLRVIRADRILRIEPISGDATGR
jgi:DNA polymerase III epsilon subunit family exonuclease